MPDLEPGWAYTISKVAKAKGRDQKDGKFVFVFIYSNKDLMKRISPGGTIG